MAGGPVYSNPDASLHPAAFTRCSSQSSPRPTTNGTTGHPRVTASEHAFRPWATRAAQARLTEASPETVWSWSGSPSLSHLAHPVPLFPRVWCLCYITCSPPGDSAGACAPGLPSSLPLLASKQLHARVSSLSQCRALSPEPGDTLPCADRPLPSVPTVGPVSVLISHPPVLHARLVSQLGGCGTRLGSPHIPPRDSGAWSTGASGTSGHGEGGRLLPPRPPWGWAAPAGLGWAPASPASPCCARSFFLRLCSEVPILEDTLMRILVIGLSRELPLGPADALELADHLVKRAAAVQADGEGLGLCPAPCG